MNDFGSMRCFVTKIMSFYDENVILSWNILIFNDDMQYKMTKLSYKSRRVLASQKVIIYSDDDTYCHQK